MEERASSKSDCSTLGNNYTLSTQSFSTSDDRSEILWIGNPIQNHNYGMLRSSFGLGDQFFDLDIVMGGNLSDDPLMIATIG